MTSMHTVYWLFGLDRGSDTIESAELFLAAPWAREGPFWLFLAIVGALVGAIFYYRRFQQRGGLTSRTLLGILRGILLSILVCMLADPFLRIHLVRQIPPSVYLLFDGTESMQTRDVEWPSAGGDRSADVTRIEAVQQFLRSEASRSAGLAAADVRLQAYRFEGRSGSRLKRIPLTQDAAPQRLSEIADQLTATGQVSALGSVLDDFSRRHAQHGAAAVVLFSDFAHNSGPWPTADERIETLRTLQVPVFTVGLGESRLTDLSIDLRVEPRVKSGEQMSLGLMVRQADLTGERVELTVHARMVRDAGTTVDAGELVGTQSLSLAEATTEVPFTFTPREPGLWEFTATAGGLVGEHSDVNNTAIERTNVIDDHLRLLYVAYEPNWEWRFVKEAFHRDPLVGIDGFRTYIESSDALVRRSNVLFLESLPSRRDQLFRNDVIILDDLPAAALARGFAELVEEFVGRLGGGLVVLAGPRFGVGQLRGSPLESILPVRLDPRLPSRRDSEFTPALTAHSPTFAFMRLGDSELSHRQAWLNLAPLPWYQPVSGVHDQAFTLLEHPRDVCGDGQSKQPLISTRRYGRGEVVFIATNELWRLRRGYGERYHRRLWSQLIYRLGMSHALGDEKRFVVRTDRSRYQVEDLVTVTVDAYDSDYDPLEPSSLAGAALQASLRQPRVDNDVATLRPLAIPWREDGVFEIRFQVAQPGQYSVEVTDPITADQRQTRFTVSGTTGETVNPVRNQQLQEELATRTGGQSYEIQSANRLSNDLRLESVAERSVKTQALWSTPFWFAIVVGLMLTEWLLRRFVQLA